MLELRDKDRQPSSPESSAMATPPTRPPLVPSQETCFFFHQGDYVSQESGSDVEVETSIASGFHEPELPSFFLYSFSFSPGLISELKLSDPSMTLCLLPISASTVSGSGVSSSSLSKRVCPTF